MFVLNTIGRAELNTRTNGGCGSGGDAGTIPVCVCVRVCGTIHSPRSEKWVVFFNPLRHWIDIHFPTSKSGSLCALLARSDIACVCARVCVLVHMCTHAGHRMRSAVSFSLAPTLGKKPPYIMCSSPAVRSMFSSTPDGTREAQKG